jgi:hypothetical protein
MKRDQRTRDMRVRDTEEIDGLDYGLLRRDVLCILE